LGEILTFAAVDINGRLGRLGNIVDRRRRREIRIAECPGPEQLAVCRPTGIESPERVAKEKLWTINEDDRRDGANRTDRTHGWENDGGPECAGSPNDPSVRGTVDRRVHNGRPRYGRRHYGRVIHGRRYVYRGTRYRSDRVLCRRERRENNRSSNRS